MRWMLHWKGGNSIITMEKFSKTIFINVGKNIVTQNFYFIKKKKFRYWKKKCNFNLITVSPKINVSHLNYSLDWKAPKENYVGYTSSTCINTVKKEFSVWHYRRNKHILLNIMTVFIKFNHDIISYKVCSWPQLIPYRARCSEMFTNGSMKHDI